MTDRVELAVRELVAALRAEMAPEPEPSTLVSIEEACRLLNVGRTSCYGLLDSQALPSVRVGRRRLIPRAALEAYATRGEA
jgi:excisionase family DNA binding protein